MSATFTANAGLGIPSLDDTDYLTTLLNSITLLDGFAPVRDFAVKLQQNPSTTLNVVVAGGTLVKRDSTEITVSLATKLMTASSTNYIYLDSSGVITVNTTGFPAGSAIAPLAIVITGVSSVTSITDSRRAYRLTGLANSSEYLLLAGGTLTGGLVLSGTGSGAGFTFTTSAAPGSPADGQHWYDSTAKCILGVVAGITERINSGLFRMTATATVANTTAETTLIGAGQGVTTIPANLFAAGKTIDIDIWGVLSTTGTPNITLQIKLGSLVLTTGAVAAGSTVTNVGFRITAKITCRTPGASGVFIGQGMAWINGTAFPMVATATSTLDSTATLAIAATATWSAASASNTISATDMVADVKN